MERVQPKLFKALNYVMNTEEARHYIKPDIKEDLIVARSSLSERIRWEEDDDQKKQFACSFSVRGLRDAGPDIAVE